MIELIDKKEIKNAGWLIGGKVAQMLISLLVGILTARYLGPSNYGLINYAAAYVTFFTSLCTLGINSVIIKNFVDHPDDEGLTIGTALLLRGCSSILSAVMITAIVFIVDANEPTTILVVALSSISLIFHIFDTFNYWFQYRYQSKITSIATLLAYIVTSAYKIILLALGKNVFWFAMATTVDYIVLAVVLFASYLRFGGQQLRFSIAKATNLLKSSYHYILSGLMMAIYGQTDKFMLKQILGETEVGYYATAFGICNMWVFVLNAIIDSMYPTILSLYKKDKGAFERKNRQLYAVIFYVSVSVSLIFTLFGNYIVSILYGEKFLPAAASLRLVTWYTAFAYLGVARNAWLVCENKQKYLKYMYFGAAIINVGLNLLLIPTLNASGAALASLITQISTSILLPLVFKEMRPNVKLLIDAIRLRGVFK